MLKAPIAGYHVRQKVINDYSVHCTKLNLNVRVFNEVGQQMYETLIGLSYSELAMMSQK